MLECQILSTFCTILYNYSRNRYTFILHYCYTSIYVTMSTDDVDKDPNKNNILINFEQQFHQLLLESKSNEVSAYLYKYNIDL